MGIIAYKKQLIILLGIVILVVLFTAYDKNFLVFDNFVYLVNSNLVLGVAALGMLVVMMVGSYDFSIGAMITTISYLLSNVIMLSDDRISLMLVLVLGMLLGGIFGGINGILVSTLKNASFVITIMTMLILRGLVNIISSGFNVTYISKRFLELKIFRIGNVFSVSFVIFTVCCMILAYLLHYTKVGRGVYVVGENEQIAERRGCNTNKVKFFAFFMSGIFAGIGAYLHIVNNNQIDVSDYSWVELQLITIVILGGVNIKGGYGSVFGTCLAFYLFNILNSSSLFVKTNTAFQGVAIGCLVVLVVGVQVWMKRNSNRMEVR